MNCIVPCRYIFGLLIIVFGLALMLLVTWFKYVRKAEK